MKKCHFILAAIWFYAAAFCSCANIKVKKIDKSYIENSPRVILGDEQSEKYLPLLTGKKVALFSNHSGIMGDKYIRLELGKDSQKLPDYSYLTKTTPYKSLEDNVREFIFLSTKDDVQKDDDK